MPDLKVWQLALLAIASISGWEFAGWVINHFTISFH